MCFDCAAVVASAVVVVSNTAVVLRVWPVIVGFVACYEKNQFKQNKNKEN